jgi:hypothetical protein
MYKFSVNFNTVLFIETVYVMRFPRTKQRVNMTFSEINNKMTTVNSEDLLTSDILGCCSFLNYEEFLKCILKEAIHFDERKKLVVNEPVLSDQYIFWPMVKTGRTRTEPDVIIILHHPENKCTLILIEAKYNSGKSSEADYNVDDVTDQLARELRIIEEQHLYAQLSGLEGKEIISKALVYVTADDIIPQKSLSDSASEFTIKARGTNYKTPMELPLYWLPWWKIEYIATKAEYCKFEDRTKNRIIGHIKDVLQIKKLSRFSGVSIINFEFPRYSYKSEIEDHIDMRYHFLVCVPPISYKYSKHKSVKEYNFNRLFSKITYNYRIRE